MPSDDLNQYKNRLREVVEYYNLEIDTRKKPPVARCINPGHSDENPSMVIYEDRLWCPVCKQSWDVFDFVEWTESAREFPEQLKYVKRALGMKADEPKKKAEPKKQGKPKPKPVTLDKKKAMEVYAGSKLQAFQDGKYGKLVQRWPYILPSQDVIGVDARFEDGKGHKTVLTFWYDGKHIRVANPPACIYNAHRLGPESDKTVLIVEGCKAAEAAQKLPGFIPVTWNGGTARTAKPDWSILKDRKVLIYPDDDQKLDPRTKELLDWYKQPGIHAAFEIQKILPHADVIRPLPAARKIKEDGADIVEALEIETPERLKDYILNAERLRPPTLEELSELQGDKFPFSILGTADDGRGYFIGFHNRIWTSSLTSISNTLLMNLAPIDWWMEEYSSRGRIDWETARAHIIQACSGIDFDPSNLHGRGAWKSKPGICYYNGKDILGEHDKDMIFVRRNKREMGLKDPPAKSQVTMDIAEAIAHLSFETTQDAIRMMSWTVIAPFAGALPWRPAALLTGPSKSGKTSILDLVIRPLARPLVLSGGATTEAGVRQQVKFDADAIVIEEAEPNTKKKKELREDLFALMRQSTSENAPKVAKGTQDQQGMSFTMNSIFCFISISPEIEFVADDNRFVRINLKHPHNKWAPIRDRLRDLVTQESCRAIRSLTWSKLKDIVILAHKLTPVIQDETGADNRLSLSEGIMLAAYNLVWQQTDLADAELPALVKDFYSSGGLETERDDTNEMIDRILDEQVQVEKPSRERISLREILIAVQTGEMPGDRADSPFPDGIEGRDKTHFRNVAGRYGVGVTDEGYLCIAQNHHAIMRTTEKSKGYQRQLWRHPGLKEKSKVVFMAGKARRCVVIEDVLELKNGVSHE